MFSNSWSDILKRNSLAVTRTELDDECQDINNVMQQKKKPKGSSDGTKRSLKKRARSYKKGFHLWWKLRKPVKGVWFFYFSVITYKTVGRPKK